MVGRRSNEIIEEEIEDIAAATYEASKDKEKDIIVKEDNAVIEVKLRVSHRSTFDGKG